MVSTDRIMLRLHIEAVWGVQLPALDLNTVELLPESVQPPWKLYVAELSTELSNARVHVWRPDIGPTEREALLTQVNEVFTLAPTVTLPPQIEREVVLQRSAFPTIDKAEAQFLARPLTSHDRELVENFELGSADYFFHADRRPLIGVIVDGRLLSVAHSSRRTADACELGIDTVPEARRKGYALAATVLWTAAVAQEGLLPLYSASADNTASLQLATASGYREFARGVQYRNLKDS